MSDSVVNIASRNRIRYCLVVDHPKIRKTVIFAELLSTFLADLQAAYPDRPEWASEWQDDPLLVVRALCPFGADVRPLFRSRDFPDLFRSLSAIGTISKRMHMAVSESTTLETSFDFTVSGDGAALFEEGIDGCVAEVWEYENSAADARFVASGVVSGGGIEGGMVSINVPVVDRSGEYADAFDEFYVIPGGATIFPGSIGKKAPLVYGSVTSLPLLAENVGVTGRLVAALTDSATDTELKISIEDSAAFPDPFSYGYYALVIDGEVILVKSYDGVDGSPYSNPATHLYAAFDRGAQRTAHSEGAEVRMLAPDYVNWIIAQNILGAAVRLRFVDSSGGVFTPTELIDICLDGEPAYAEFFTDDRTTLVEFTGDVDSSEGTITIDPSDWVISDLQFAAEGVSFSRQLYESHAPPTLPDWTALDVDDEWNNNEKFYIGCSATDSVSAGERQVVYELTLASNVLPGVAANGDRFRITVHTQPNAATIPSVYDDTTQSYRAVKRYILAKNETGEYVDVASNITGDMQIEVGDTYGWYWYNLDRTKLNDLKIQIWVRPDYFTPEQAVTVVGWIASATYLFQSAALVDDLDNITDGNSSTFASLIARPGETSTRIVAFNVKLGAFPFIPDRVVKAVKLKIKYKLDIDASSSVKAKFYYRSGGSESNEITLTNGTDPAAEIEHDIFVGIDDGYQIDDFVANAYVRFTITTVDGDDVFELYYVKIEVTTLKTGSVGYFYGNTATLDVSGPTDSNSCTGLDDGFITGTADALIANPVDVVKSILLVDCGLDSSRIDTQSFTVARDYYNRLFQGFFPFASSTSAGMGYVTYSGESWEVNQWAGYTLGYPNSGARYLVKSNTATTLYMKDSHRTFSNGIYSLLGVWRCAGTSGNEYSIYSLFAQIQDSFMLRIGEDTVKGRQRYKACYPLFGVKPVIQARLFGVGGEAHDSLPSFKIKAGNYTFIRADDPIKYCKVRFGRQLVKIGSAQAGQEDGWTGMQESENRQLDRGRSITIDAEWIRDSVTAKLLSECVLELYKNAPKIWTIPVPPDAINFCSWGTIVEVVGRGFVYGSDRGLEGRACMVVGYDYEPSKGGTLLVSDRAMWSYVPWEGYAPTQSGGGGGE